jgi:8-oxo-dGTP pyrophosphatase MutT (NUDIX family)
MTLPDGPWQALATHLIHTYRYAQPAAGGVATTTERSVALLAASPPWTMTAMTDEPKKRRGARVLLVDGEHRVLLIKFVLPAGATVRTFWATPGGGIEDDENDLQAAERELAEELGIKLELQGPVHTATALVEFGGVLTENTDVFFVSRYEGQELHVGAPTEEERSVMKLAKWWSSEEIRNSREPVFPTDLCEVLNRLAASRGVPQAPPPSTPEGP